MALNAQAREESFIDSQESLEACERIHSRLLGTAVRLFSHGWDGLELGARGPQSRLFWEFGEVTRWWQRDSVERQHSSYAPEISLFNSGNEGSQVKLPPSCVLAAKGHALPLPGMAFAS